MRAIAEDQIPTRASPPTDHDLLRMSLDRPELFAEIFDRHSPAIHRYLSRRVGDHADDLLSETFLTAFRKRREYRPDRLDVRPWLYGIAANLVRRLRHEEIARYRALGRSIEATNLDETAAELESALDRVDAQRISARLATALSQLKPRDLEVLLLIAWADLTYPEAAAALDIPVGTVRSRLHRARRLLRKDLDLPADDRERLAPAPTTTRPTPAPSTATDLETR